MFQQEVLRQHDRTEREGNTSVVYIWWSACATAENWFGSEHRVDWTPALHKLLRDTTAHQPPRALSTQPASSATCQACHPLPCQPSPRPFRLILIIHSVGLELFAGTKQAYDNFLCVSAPICPEPPILPVLPALSTPRYDKWPPAGRKRWRGKYWRRIPKKKEGNPQTKEALMASCYRHPPPWCRTMERTPTPSLKQHCAPLLWWNWYL